MFQISIWWWKDNNWWELILQYNIRVYLVKYFKELIVKIKKYNNWYWKLISLENKITSNILWLLRVLIKNCY